MHSDLDLYICFLAGAALATVVIFGFLLSTGGL